MSYKIFINLNSFHKPSTWHPNLIFVVGLAYQGKDIVFRFIIEYSSLRDFYRPLGNNNINNRSIFYMRIFER